MPGPILNSSPSNHILGQSSGSSRQVAVPSSRDAFVGQESNPRTRTSEASPGAAHRISVNIKEGEKKERQMRSGVYTVSDVYCSDCGEELGWRYIKAFEETQKYKEGKFVLEIFKIVKSSA
ncbi:hypothetical protein K1719_044831 [Acacia pycnantha]|nr:hypothetical protein K1719_044831 [Acacia pycnantha]